jgi:hypothetical protein
MIECFVLDRITVLGPGQYHLAVAGGRASRAATD